MTNINQGKPWSQTDDDDLRLEGSAGETIEYAATFLCRPVAEVLSALLSSGCDGTARCTRSEGPCARRRGRLSV